MNRLFVWLALILPLLIWIGVSYSALPNTAQQVNNNQGQSIITYVLRHPLHTVRGINRQVSSHITYNAGNISAVYVKAPGMYFDSGNKTRDKNMLKVTEANRYPYVTFTSTKIKSQYNQLQVAGILTFHGVAKEIAFEADQENTKEHIVVNGEFIISLKEFKIERPSVFGIAVKDKVLIQFSIAYPASEAK
jgi:polyisoprenoid-binding protein YceI